MRTYGTVKKRDEVKRKKIKMFLIKYQEDWDAPNNFTKN